MATVQQQDELPAATESIPYIMVVLDPAQATELLSDGKRMAAFLHAVPAAFGPVTLGLLLINLERTLVTRERREYDAAMRSGTFPLLRALCRLLCCAGMCQ